MCSAISSIEINIAFTIKVYFFLITKTDVPLLCLSAIITCLCFICLCCWHVMLLLTTVWADKNVSWKIVHLSSQSDSRSWDQRSNLGDIVPCNWTSVHSTGSSVRKSVLTGEPSSWRRVTHHHHPRTSRDTFNTFQLDLTRLWMYLLRISISLVTLIFHSIQSLLYSLEYES